MARPKGSKGRGARCAVNRMKRQFLRDSKLGADLGQLKGLVSVYEGIVVEALHNADAADLDAVWKLSQSVAALTRAKAAIGRIERANELQNEAKAVSHALQKVLDMADAVGVNSSEIPDTSE